MTIRVAYLINQYPKVSHTFIRREILALERRGISVLRIAINRCAEDLSDKDDISEQTKTSYVLKDGYFLLLLFSLLRILVTAPRAFFKSLVLAISMSWKADRPLPYHIAYLAEACAILPIVKKFGATHIHAHFATNSAEVAMLVHSLAGLSYSFTVHGTAEFDRIHSLGISTKVRSASFVISICSHGRSQLYRWLDSQLWPKINLIHCGLEPSFYSKSTPLTSEFFPRRFACVGRLSKEKGQLLLLEAARILSEEGYEFEIVLAGDGEMRGEIEDLISRYALAGKVWITGWISSDQVREEILASRALVLPSFSEGLPVVIMEAMSLRRPVLSTYVGGIPELVVHEQNGYLFPAGSIIELLAALRSCLEADSVTLASMGEQAFHCLPTQ